MATQKNDKKVVGKGKKNKVIVNPSLKDLVEKTVKFMKNRKKAF